MSKKGLLKQIKNNFCPRCKKKMRLIVEQNKQTLKCFNCGFRIDYETGKRLDDDREILQAFRNSLSAWIRLKSGILWGLFIGALLGAVFVIVHGYNNPFLVDFGLALLSFGIALFCFGFALLYEWFKEVLKFKSYLELIGCISIISLLITSAFVGAYSLMPMNEPLILSDSLNDFVYVEGTEKDVGASLHCIDIEEVKIWNDGKNLNIMITTREILPSKGPEYPARYVVTVLIIADDDGDKFASAYINIDDLGWSLGSNIGDEQFFEEKSLIKYEKSGNTVTFKVPLDHREWRENPRKMSVCVMVGYEFSPFLGSSDKKVRVYDFVPDQTWNEKFQYEDYELWKD